MLLSIGASPSNGIVLSCRCRKRAPSRGCTDSCGRGRNSSGRGKVPTFFLRRKELERVAVARKPPPRAAPCLSRKLSRPPTKPRCRRWSKPVKMPALMRAGGCWQRSRTPPLMTSASARPSSQRSRPRAPPTCTVNFAAVLQKDAERGETYPAWSKESLTCTRRQAAGTMLPPSLWLEWETYP